jgi:hypothetical protein
MPANYQTAANGGLAQSTEAQAAHRRFRSMSTPESPMRRRYAEVYELHESWSGMFY